MREGRNVSSSFSTMVARSATLDDIAAKWKRKMMVSSSLILTSLLLVTTVTASQEDGGQEASSSSFSFSSTLTSYWRNNSCTLLSSDCGKCVRSPECSWCLDPDLKGPRCDLRQRFLEPDQCDKLEDPDNSVEILQNKPLTPDGSGDGDKFVQISPQKVRVRLRVGKEQTIKFFVAQAKQYPVDLYYLMDLSNSMSDDKANIVKLGEELASAIQNITNDFRIGFGSFVDKEVLPFISLVPGKNCQQSSCPKPYSFQHQMKLSPDVKLFQRKVSEAPISGNIDNPEGGFDGLVQVMVCDDAIGWRKQSRRVVIFTTDQSFHMAMDGKLGGIVVPNDGKCHLNPSGFYTHSTVQDYPSLGQIQYLAERHKVSVIWAVTADQIDLYSSVTTLVESSSAGIISEDSSNVVDLVRQQYKKITTKIKVQSNSSRHCQSEITSAQCGGGEGEGESSECKDIELGTAVEFELSLTLKECVSGETIAVSPVGIKDQMLVEIVPICECPCQEEEEDGDVGDRPTELLCNSPACNAHGHLVCGTCSCCGDVFFGPTCSCQHVPDSGVDPADPDASCRPEGGSTHTPLCSGRGECLCGECKCLQMRPGVVVTGEFCQEVCDNTACPSTRQNGSLLVCSGHGDCLCGTCRCHGGWTGDDCSCRTDPAGCRSPDTPDLICSGHGSCPCDRCLCTTDRYTGEFCETCETCPSICQELRPCVECRAFGAEMEGEEYDLDDGGDGDLNCTGCTFDYSERRGHEIPQEWENCTMKHGSCDYTFSYSNYHPTLMPKFIVLHLHGEEEERKEICPPPPDFFGIIFGVVGAIVCLGLLTLFLWKAFTTVHDRREFVRFEAERQRIKFPAHSNPIFRQATTTVQNPIFNSPNHF